jgi:hypothetical protein
MGISGYETIADAVGQTDPSGIVQILPGTYIESNISIAKALTIEGETGSTALAPVRATATPSA